MTRRKASRSENTLQIAIQTLGGQLDLTQPNLSGGYICLAALDAPSGWIATHKLSFEEYDVVFVMAQYYTTMCAKRRRELGALRAGRWQEWQLWLIERQKMDLSAIHVPMWNMTRIIEKSPAISSSLLTAGVASNPSSLQRQYEAQLNYCTVLKKPKKVTEWCSA
jgi:hypothetical protein